MRAAAQSFRTPNLHRALASWKAASSSRLNARRSLQRAAQRMISQSLATCWRTWVEMAVTQRQVVRSLQFSMRFFMNRMLALGLQLEARSRDIPAPICPAPSNDQSFPHP